MFRGGPTPSQWVFIASWARAHVAIFETDNFDTTWLYALRFVTWKVSVSAVSLLFPNLLFAKLSLIVFGAESHWQFVSICSCFIRN